MVNKRVQNAVLGCTLKNDTMISVRFQGKSFSITVIQVYAPTSNAEVAEVGRFYEDLQDLLELTPKKRCPFHSRGLECKSRKSRKVRVTGYKTCSGSQSQIQTLHTKQCNSIAFVLSILPGCVLYYNIN